MKVLFAVNNENISNLIVKKYQKDYKEIISFKNVYYFNAILKEIQKDKSYDRIVISEDLEQFTNSSYQQMDKFIFDRLDSISDEASNMNGEDIPIILICSERRTKGEETLVKLFGIGIYNALIGKDRDIDEVCNLINKPRSKKEAKEYYRIDTEDVSYQAESENDVSEIEIQNILAHYKRLGKNEDKYVESFDNIALQYNDIQLKIICKFLPLNVRAVLEEKSPKYQKLMAFNKSVSGALKSKEKQQAGTSEKLLITPNSKPGLSRPVVIPTTIKKGQAKKLTKTESESKKTSKSAEKDILEDILNQPISTIESENTMPIVEEEPTTIKRGRGRPKKVNTDEKVTVEEKSNTSKKGRGRPKKLEETPQELPILEEEESNELPGFDDFDNFVNDNSTTNYADNFLPGDEENENNEIDEFSLPGFDEEDEEESNEQDIELPNIEQKLTQVDENYTDNPFGVITSKKDDSIVASNYEGYGKVDISGLLTKDKKIVTVVGTSKNGTSFILNNLAELLSSQGINVAILDATQNRNSYYIYTKNEENLRRIAFESIRNLSIGTAKGIPVNNNLTVYTSLPSESSDITKVGTILETLVKNHSLILIDCDFQTPLDYFANAQEIYLVQSMDVLTIQPLTAFLRELKTKNILDENKIRIIINKYIKLRSVTEKAIIGGMAYYNDPAMSFMTELFNRNTVKYITIPFEEEIYAKYLEGLINCDISLKGYSKTFMQTLKQLGNSVYPLISGKSSYQTSKPSYQSNFSPNINNTLNQMKKNY